MTYSARDQINHILFNLRESPRYREAELEQDLNEIVEQARAQGRAEGLREALQLCDNVKNGEVIPDEYAQNFIRLGIEWLIGGKLVLE